MCAKNAVRKLLHAVLTGVSKVTGAPIASVVVGQDDVPAVQFALLRFATLPSVGHKGFVPTRYSPPNVASCGAAFTPVLVHEQPVSVAGPPVPALVQLPLLA